MDYKKDFPMLNKNIVYFDNGATSLKPKCVIDRMNEYYFDYSSNHHRGDYDISFKVDDMIDKTRDKVKDFIGAENKNEIIFTNNTTHSLNMVVFGFFYDYLNDGDEVIISKSEHASNILPWLILSMYKDIKIVFLESKKFSISELKRNINSNTKVISLAYVTNVYSDKRDIKEISKIAHKNNILFVVDGAQSISYLKTDVVDLDIDFFCFSAHKMCGPTGIGVLYGKHKYLEKMKPYMYGGGMNINYDNEEIILESIPHRFEAGTLNIAGIIGLYEAINYIENIGINNIERKCKYLRKYLIKELEKIDYIKIYNKDFDGNSVIINMDNIMSGDLGLYLNSKNICVRSGMHCAKMIDNEDTVRISLYFYNTYEEIDYLISVLKEKDEIIKFCI